MSCSVLKMPAVTEAPAPGSRLPCSVTTGHPLTVWYALAQAVPESPLLS